jgi:hypothetical protein
MRAAQKETEMRQDMTRDYWMDCVESAVAWRPAMVPERPRS